MTIHLRAHEHFDFDAVLLPYSYTMLQNEQYNKDVTALSIHQLENHEREHLYYNIFQMLPEKGCFINHDQFNADAPLMNQLYNSWCYASIKKNGLSDYELE